MPYNEYFAQLDAETETDSLPLFSQPPVKQPVKDVVSLKENMVIQLIADYRRGREITSKKIEEMLKIASTEVRDIVREARRRAVPVGSNSRGYYLIVKESELTETQHHLRSRALSQLETYNIMKRIKFSDLPVQLRIFGQAV